MSTFLKIVAITVSISFTVKSACNPTDICIGSGNADGSRSNYYTCKNNQIYSETFLNDDCAGSMNQLVTNSTAITPTESCNGECLSYVIIREYTDTNGTECSKASDWYDTVYSTGCDGHGSRRICTDTTVTTEFYTGSNCDGKRYAAKTETLTTGCPGTLKIDTGAGSRTKEQREARATITDTYTEILYCGGNYMSIKTVTIIAFLFIVFWM
eukprot:278504_1